MKFSLFNRILIGFTIALLLIVALGTLNFYTSFRLTDHYRELEKSKNNVLLLEETGSLVKDIQRAHRGFVVTHDKRFLDPYYNSIEAMPAIKTRIRTSPNWQREQTPELQKLIELINVELNHADDALFDTSRLDQDSVRIKIIEGKTIVDSINLSIGRLKGVELFRQEHIKDEIDSHNSMNKTAIVSSIITFIILLTIGLLKIYDVIKERHRLYSDLHARTDDSAAANEKLNVLNEELNASNENLSQNVKMLESARAELLLREKQLNAAQIIARTGSFTFDTQTKRFSHSDSYALIFGLREGEKISSFEDFLSYVHPEDRNKMRMSGEAFVSNHGLITQQFRLRIDGRTKHIQAAGQMVDQQEGGALFLGAITDITELTEAREKLQEANRKLIESNTDLEAFTYSISHDLKAPVRSLLMYIHLLLDKPGQVHSEEEKKWLDVLLRKARHMDELIEGLLSLSRYGSSSLRIQEVDMAGVVQDVADELRADFAHAEISIMNSLGRVHADEGLIKQVWINLIGNALKFSSKSASAKILISRQDGENFACFSIQDNGVGFEEERASELFTVFKRLHSNDDFAGSGVGLAIVKRIITSHGGDIEAHGTPGGGSHFIFRLPNQSPVGAT